MLVHRMPLHPIKHIKMLAVVETFLWRTSQAKVISMQVYINNT